MESGNRPDDPSNTLNGRNLDPWNPNNGLAPQFRVCSPPGLSSISQAHSQSLSQVATARGTTARPWNQVVREGKAATDKAATYKVATEKATAEIGLVRSSSSRNHTLISLLFRLGAVTNYNKMLVVKAAEISRDSCSKVLRKLGLMFCLIGHEFVVDVIRCNRGNRIAPDAIRVGDAINSKH
ncbi:hypothetical protein MMC31_001477 [Peltigera leucophlebia]|nr:hypothetical protein [Peltigera leucophlebia]